MTSICFEMGRVGRRKMVGWDGICCTTYFGRVVVLIFIAKLQPSLRERPATVAVNPHQEY